MDGFDLLNIEFPPPQRLRAGQSNVRPTGQMQPQKQLLIPPLVIWLSQFDNWALLFPENMDKFYIFYLLSFASNGFLCYNKVICLMMSLPTLSRHHKFSFLLTVWKEFDIPDLGYSQLLCNMHSVPNKAAFWHRCVVISFIHRMIKVFLYCTYHLLLLFAASAKFLLYFMLFILCIVFMMSSDSIRFIFYCIYSFISEF